MIQTLTLQVRIDENGAVQKVEQLASAVEKVTKIPPLPKLVVSDLFPELDVMTKKIEAMNTTIAETSRVTTTIAPAANGAALSLSSIAGSAVMGPLRALSPELANISSQLLRIGTAAESTKTTMSALGTAGLVVGAAFAGWNIGRAISDFFDLDEAIGRSYAALLGLGDVAAQEAGARMDALAHTIETVAYRIGDVTLALTPLELALVKAAQKTREIEESNAEFAAEIKRLNATDDEWTARATKNAELRAAAAAKELEALRRVTEEVRRLEGGPNVNRLEALASYSSYGEKVQAPLGVAEQQHMAALAAADAAEKALFQSSYEAARAQDALNAMNRAAVAPVSALTTATVAFARSAGDSAWSVSSAVERLNRMNAQLIADNARDASARAMGVTVAGMSPAQREAAGSSNYRPSDYGGQGVIIVDTTPPRPMAFGGSGIATRPTLFLAGEAGPEPYAFGASARGGGGGDVHNHFDMRGMVTDEAAMEKLADKLSIVLGRRGSIGF